MKYIAIAAGYLIMWSILTPVLLIERAGKILALAPFKNKLLGWTVKNLKDYYLLRNWELTYF